MKTLLIYLSGKCPQLLKQAGATATHRAKMDGIAILIPGLVALGSYSYTIYLISSSVIAGIIGGILSAFVLIMIDRSIMNADSVWNLGVLGRVIFAGVAGFVVAEGVILLAFSDRIESYLKDDVFKEQRIAAADYDNDIANLRKDISSRNTFLESKQKEVWAEMDGIGELRYGQGPNYDKKLADYTKSEKQVRSYNTADSLNILSIEKEKEARLKSVKDNYEDGYYAKLKALQKATNDDERGIMILYLYLFRILFASIELIPLFMKLSRSSKNDILNVLHKSNEKSIIEANEELQKSKTSSYKLKRMLDDLEHRFKLENVHRKKMSDSIRVASQDKYQMLENHALAQQRAERRLLKNIKNPIDQERLLSKLQEINTLEIERIMSLIKSNYYRSEKENLSYDYKSIDLDINDDVSVESDTINGFDDSIFDDDNFNGKSNAV
ncbi:DUF4407 domain-containing protein [Xanthomarina sp. F1114]|uniref:DUF4407 domain-containing protein n=1 Tax=Xanthomarina sp. F1114 TaxID=2996019 RepID=UPI00225E001F|nr:DUF4407 domain-containing protein [Xanthomarina sp. F1114]MCX7547769.1 DUF4407 domain-containing protein [Xanthomarina sp. F1114]